MPGSATLNYLVAFFLPPIETSRDDELLSAEVSEVDGLYRLRRDRTVIYVDLQALDIVKPDNRTWGPGLLKDLRRNVDIWDHPWTTLTILRRDGEIRCLQDQWTPHFLPPGVNLVSNVPRLNFVDLEILEFLKPSVSVISLDDRRQIVKICPFKWLFRWLRREAEAYALLTQRGCRLIPRLSAYVFERSEEQIVGFVVEELQGRWAGPDDGVACRRGLARLHSYGIVHGDVNRFNIMITSDGPRFLDLEKAVFDTDGLPSGEFARLQQEEMDGLDQALRSREIWGRPWPSARSPAEPTYAK